MMGDDEGVQQHTRYSSSALLSLFPETTLLRVAFVEAGNCQGGPIPRHDRAVLDTPHHPHMVSISITQAHTPFCPLPVSAAVIVAAAAAAVCPHQASSQMSLSTRWEYFSSDLCVCWAGQKREKEVVEK